MNYLNDTQRVEMALPAHIMMAVMLAGAEYADPGPQPEPRTKADALQMPMKIMKWRQAWNEHNKRLETDPVFKAGYDEFLATKALLVEAMDEPIQDVFPAKKRASLLRRIVLLHVKIIEPYTMLRESGEDDTDPRKIGLIGYHMIQTLVDQEYLIIPEHSAFGQALEVLLPGLSPQKDSDIPDYENLNFSAQKAVKKIFRALRNEKYYLGLHIPNN